jgi:hypothetical protein
MVPAIVVSVSMHPNQITGIDCEWFLVKNLVLLDSI